MLKSFYFLFFSSFLGGGILMAISSSSMFSIWVGLEMTTLSFVSFLMLSSSTEGPVKYFLVQSLGSLGVVESILMGVGHSVSLSLYMGSLLLKIGAAPVHFWFPQVCNVMAWGDNMILMTFQKIIPLYLLASIVPVNSLSLLSVLSAGAGAAGGFNERSLRKLLAFSSVSHTGWILFSMKVDGSFWLWYFAVYCISVFLLLSELKIESIFSVGELQMAPKKASILLGFLSLGGFPPLLGFSPKWALIYLFSSSSFVWVLLLCVFSVITLYFYIKSSLISSIFFSEKSKLLKSESGTSFFFFMYLILMPVLWGVSSLLL